MNKEVITHEFRQLQDRICKRLESIDGRSLFHEDLWDRNDGGGGRTRVLSKGEIIEKGGVNFSEVYGDVTELMRQNTEINGNSFYATGVSIVLHPNSPHLPIIHMNVRYFELDNGKYWFGGGIDLTPHYVVPNQAQQFHAGLKSVCDKYKSDFYPRFKEWADNYFFLPHRDETRGVGGIFFDHLNESEGLSKQEIFNFCVELGDTFAELYSYQVDKGVQCKVNSEHIEWRNLRRGRYVEFNLVNDRGTKFGLISGGRTESILMSLPSMASLEYNKAVSPDSDEAKTLTHLKKNIDWLNYS